MRYRDFEITACSDNGVVRTDPDTGRDMVCNGYYCQVYQTGDADYSEQIDDFCLAIGHELPDDSDESLETGIRRYVDDMFFSLQEEKERIMAEQM